MKNYISLLLIFLAFIGISCQNDETIDCNINNPTIVISSTIFAGTNIYLKTPNYYISNVTYNWSGPNNFHSNEQNPVISNATLAMSGEYKLTIKKGICLTDEIKSTVNVITNTVNCSQYSDTSNLSNGYGSFNLYYNTTNIIENNYVVSGGGTDLNVKITFLGSNKPEIGIYSIIKKSETLSAGKVKIENILFNTSSYNALNGNVAIDYDLEGNVIAKYCTIPFAQGNNTTTSFTANALFTKNQ